MGKFDGGREMSVYQVLDGLELSSGKYNERLEHESRRAVVVLLERGENGMGFFQFSHNQQKRNDHECGNFSKFHFAAGFCCCRQRNAKPKRSADHGSPGSTVVFPHFFTTLVVFLDLPLVRIPNCLTKVFRIFRVERRPSFFRISNFEFRISIRFDDLKTLFTNKLLFVRSRALFTLKAYFSVKTANFTSFF